MALIARHFPKYVEPRTSMPIALKRSTSFGVDWRGRCKATQRDILSLRRFLERVTPLSLGGLG